MNKITDSVIVLLLISSSFAGMILIISPLQVSAYTPHDPILIVGDEDFAEQAALEGWPGDGTEGNPYEIEGFEIDTTSDDGIKIESTTVHFIIRDTIFPVDEYFWLYANGGIAFYNVRNGIIKNCTIKGTMWGIYLYFSSEIKITGNNISNCWGGRGIFLRNSEDNDIYTNNITTCKGGIHLEFSNRNNVLDNDFHNIDDYNINIRYSVQNNFKGNKMFYSGIFIDGDHLKYWDSNYIDNSNLVDEKPVYFWKNITNEIIPLDAGQVIIVNCSNITIKNQEINYATPCIMLAFSNNCSVRNNKVHFGRINGIYLYRSNNNHISNNDVDHNDEFGIYLNYSSRNIIINNRINNNWDGGIFLDNSVSNDIFNNDILGDNFWFDAKGINLINSSGNKIDDNNVSGYEYGIYFLYSMENTILSNNISNSHQNIPWNGIHLDLSNRNDIIDNNVSNSSRNGLYLESSNENNIIGNTASFNRIGIHLQGSNGNNLTDNMAFSNEVNGFMIWRSNWTNIINNSAFSNDCGIGISDSNNNTIYNNNFSSNLLDGFYFFEATENDIIGNLISYNHRGGISFDLYSNRNYVTGNNISNNLNGISIEVSENNIFHHNYIDNNRYQLNQTDDSFNIWENEDGQGNYWSDYEGVDNDGDGVGDTKLPHQGVDNHPLTDRRGQVSSDPWYLLLFIPIIIIILALFLRKKQKSPKKPYEEESWEKIQL